MFGKTSLFFYSAIQTLDRNRLGLFCLPLATWNPCASLGMPALPSVLQAWEAEHGGQCTDVVQTHFMAHLLPDWATTIRVWSMPPVDLFGYMKSGKPVVTGLWV